MVDFRFKSTLSVFLICIEGGATFDGFDCLRFREGATLGCAECVSIGAIEVSVIEGVNSKKWLVWFVIIHICYR